MNSQIKIAIGRFLISPCVVFLDILLFFFFLPVACLLRALPKRRHEYVLICGIETSNNIRQISSTLSTQKAFKVHVLEFYDHPFYGNIFSKNVKVLEQYRSDHKKKFFFNLIKRIKRSFFIFQALYRYQIIFFNWTDSFLSFNLDYFLFNIAGKVLIIRHCGDDVRYRPFQHAVHSFFGIDQWKNGKRNVRECLSKYFKQRIAEFNGLVLSTRDHATFQKNKLITRPYIQEPLHKTIGFDLPIPIILHAPSDPKIKGTQIVLDAINILKNKKRKFDFVYLTKVGHQRVLDELAKTAILVDQPGAVPARLAHEGLASGCVVIGGNCMEIHQQANLPVIQFPNDSLELSIIIENLIDDWEQAKKIGQKGFDYWLNNNSPSAFLEYFDQILNGKGQSFFHLECHYDLIYKSCDSWIEKLFIQLVRS